MHKSGVCIAAMVACVGSLVGTVRAQDAQPATRCTVIEGVGKDAATPVEVANCEIDVRMRDGGTFTFEYTLETPIATPPEGGWPVVFLFHGQGHPREHWSHCRKVYGLFPVCGQKRFKEKLHARGFATVAPDSHRLPSPIQDGSDKIWRTLHQADYRDRPEFDEERATSVFDVPYEVRKAREVEANPDLQLVVQLIDALGDDEAVDGGPLYDPADVYAAGFSNGGVFTMVVAQYLPEYIRAGATQSAGYVPALFGLEGLDWRGEIAPNHPPMVVVNTLALDWVPLFVGVHYKDDLIRSGTPACHFSQPVGLHAWQGGLDGPVLDLFTSDDKSLPTNPFCLPQDFSEAP